MTKKQLAEEYLYELYNDANHADKLSQCARADFEAGDFEGALGILATLRDRPAAVLEMRVRYAIRAVEEAAAEAAVKKAEVSS